jgi:hypothetical protein
VPEIRWAFEILAVCLAAQLCRSELSAAQVFLLAWMAFSWPEAYYYLTFAVQALRLPDTAATMRAEGARQATIHEAPRMRE